MKIIINTCFGGFRIPDDIMQILGGCNVSNLKCDEECPNIRRCPMLIKMIEEGAIIDDSDCTRLEVVEIPDESTDYDISEYDGYESVIYVVNGKIHYKEGIGGMYDQDDWDD